MVFFVVQLFHRSSCKRFLTITKHQRGGHYANFKICCNPKLLQSKTYRYPYFV